MTKKKTIYKYTKRMNHDKILEIVKEHYPEALIADGFNSAIVGYTNEGKLVYRVAKMIDILMTRDEMSEEDAMEYIDYNVLGAYVGEMTPIYIYTE
tara:strand:+ start:1882 stop:2169 length:288 start_codon:yes stop_codon:yes gene_type:complete